MLYLCAEIINSYQVNRPKTGIPIGNLTSQIFANIYLHEFDRFVRHAVKPLAYVRYGDDAILLLPNRATARVAHTKSRDFLNSSLKLTINPKNDAIFAANQPLHFLGHVITREYIIVDRHTTNRALQKANLSNIASYKALKLVKWSKRQLDWQFLDEITETIT
jgi:retron-type reverse transcriptase